MVLHKLAKYAFLGSRLFASKNAFAYFLSVYNCVIVYNCVQIYTLESFNLKSSIELYCCPASGLECKSEKPFVTLWCQISWICTLTQFSISHLCIRMPSIFHMETKSLSHLEIEVGFLNPTVTFLDVLYCLCGKFLASIVIMSIDLRPHPVCGLLLVSRVIVTVVQCFPFSFSHPFLFHFQLTELISVSPVNGKLLVCPAIHHVQCFLSHNNCQEPTASRTYLLFLQISPQVQDL